MIVRKFKPSDARVVCTLITKTFKEFVEPDFSAEALSKIYQNNNPQKYIDRSKVYDIYVAEINGKVVGMGEVNKKYHISGLYVKKSVHGKGVGSAIMKKMESLCKRRGAKYITLRSSQYAYPFYLSKGYKRTTRLIRAHGLVYQPMKKYLTK